MAAASMFSMSPYQWTDTARLASENMKAASDTTSKMDKKKPKAGGGSGLGGILGSVVGGIAGSMIPGAGTAAGTMLGSAIGGGIGGAIDGGSSGAASGLASGLGMGLSLAGSDTFTGAMDGLWGNLGIKGSQASGGFDFSSAGKSANQWDSGYRGIDTNIGDSMALRYGPMGLGLGGLV